MKTYKKIISGTVLALIAFLGLSFGIVKANPSYFMPTVQTTIATSTPAIVTTATSSTLILDSYAYQAINATDKATLLIQDTASSSTSQIKISFTYSQDGIDYFNNNLIATTTTGVYVSNLETPNTYSLLGNTSASTTRVAITLPVPVRFAKVTFTGLVGTSSVWAQIVPQRQIK